MLKVLSSSLWRYHTTKCSKMNKDSPFVLLTMRWHVTVRANKRSIHTAVFFQSFLRDLIPKRKPERSWVESTSSQWLCWPFLLPYGLRAILGVGGKRRNAHMGWAGKGPDSFIWFFWLLSHCTVSSKLQLPAEEVGKGPTAAICGRSHMCTST